jgi:YbbR domain-containing protein
MTGTPVLRPQSALQRRLRAAFTVRLGLKATAVFIALVLWFVINAKEPQLQLVPVRFTPVLDSSLVLRDPVPPVQAIVAGSPKELIKLTSNLPRIHRQITADSPDTLVIDLRPDDVTLPDGVDAVVRDVQPRSVTLRFESTWSRKVPVRSQIDVATIGYPGPVSLRFDPESVEVTGPRHIVVGVSSVRTVKTTISFPDSLPHLIDIDTIGLNPAIHVRPAQVKAQLSLTPPHG